MDIKKFQFYESRIELFLEKLNKNSFLLDSCKLNALYYPSKDHVTFAKRLELTALPIQEGEVYGGEWENAWFHFSAEMPQSYIGKNIAVRLNLGGEIMICDDNGVPIYGLTHTSVFALNYTKEYFTIIKNAKQGDKIDFWCEAAAHGLIGKENALDDSIDNCCGLCSIMEVGIFHEDLWQFYADFRIVHSLFKSYDPKSARAVQLLVALNEAINIYEDNSLNAGKARLPLQKILNCRALDSEFTTTTIGHAHIDVGWLWQVKESIRKAARTFASQIDLIQKYPDYKQYGL